MADYWVKQGDTAPPITGTVTDLDGAPVDLDGATVTMSMRRMRSLEIAFDDADVTVEQTEDEDTKGTWSFEWPDGATDVDPGGYQLELHVFIGDGLTSYPTKDYLKVAVTDAIGEMAS